MDAKELKLLNLVLWQNEIVPVDLISNDEINVIHKNSITGWYTVNISDISPVEITEEILLKAAFEKFEMSETEKSYSIYLPRNRRLSVIILGESKLIQITSCSKDEPFIPVDFVCLFNEDYDGKLYIHKLQNLVYDLTGKELEIKL